MKRSRQQRQSVQQVVQHKFGFEHLRPGQADAIQALLTGQDTLVVMPTGSGKSAIYQTAAVMIPGPTVVVSPLIALQRDQVQAISDTEQSIGDAVAVNSSVSQSDRQEAFDDLQTGEAEFLFLAPEQFNNPETLAEIQAAQPSLFVIDEAHCVSEWGHDFRPDYLRLGGVIENLGHPTVLALTATAAPPVRQEIVERLNMQQPQIIVQGFDRPNIWLGVERFEDESEKQAHLLALVARAEKPGIIYVATRKRSEEIANALEQEGIQAEFYHAGRSSKDRQAIEQAFMQDEIEVLVATTAFGMGVDKSNVRFVFHADISDSIDSYYQEIGRAGRDEQLAQAILFYNPNDLKLQRFLSSSSPLEPEQIEQVVTLLQYAPGPIDPHELPQQIDLSQAKLKTLINHLATAAIAEILPTGEIQLCLSPANLDLKSLVQEITQAQESYQQFERSRLEMMRSYAEVQDCRREYILNYFGEVLETPCGFCDNCKAGITTDDSGFQPFPLNSRVRHKSWGEGLVMRYEGDKIVVLFDQVGYKTLSVGIALLERLLYPI